MHQNILTTENTCKQFAQTIIAEGTIWGLTSSKGFINTPSREFEDSQVIPFWFTETLAEAAAEKAWEGFKPTAMPLSEFLENWLVGMYNEGFLVGINWKPQMFGAEVEPLDLALEIAAQLTTAGKEIQLSKYKDIHDYHMQVKKTMETA